MKRILSYLLVLIMLIPCIVLADYKYDDGVKKTDTYIFTYSDYARYMKVKEGLPYGFNNGTAVSATGFKFGGFITKPEYDITNSGPSTSWLAPGIEYWLIGKNKLDTKLKTGTDEDTSGVRITEYVLHNTKVKGTGSITNPWIFRDGYIVTVGVTDKTIGQISPENGYEHVEPSEGAKEFILTYDNKYEIDTKACEIAAAANEATFSMVNGSSANTKKITINNISKDFSCFINFGTNCYAITFNNNGGTGGIGGQQYYYQYGKGWFSDNICKTVLSPSITSPTRVGYTYQGYKYKINNTYGKTIVNASNKIVPGVKDPDVQTNTAYAHWNPITYTVNYDCNPGTGTIESSTHTFDAAKNLNASNCVRTGYSFKGWSRTANSSTVEFKDEARVTNLANTQGATVTLYAVWKDETAPTCVAEKSNTGTTSGVTVTVTCSDDGSGCPASSTYTKTEVKADTTYTVYDNAGNSGTCSVSITESNCQGYNCNPYDCNGHNCNGHYKNCNCRTVQEACGTYQDCHQQGYSCQYCVQQVSAGYNCDCGYHPPNNTYYCKVCIGQKCIKYGTTTCYKTVCSTKVKYCDKTKCDSCYVYDTCYDTCYNTCYKTCYN